MEHDEDDEDDEDVDEMGDEASGHVSTESVSVSEIYSLNNCALKEKWDKKSYFRQTVICSYYARLGPARHRYDGRGIWYLN